MRILITGATGSLGTALVHHLLAHTTHRIIGYSRDELKQSQLRERFPDPRLDFFLGDVRDLERLHLALSADVDAVIHAAALKRVDATSYNPDEILNTNILGSRNVLRAAMGKVRQVLLISSDKACQPTNVYGASKLMAEYLFTSFNVYGAPKGTYSSVVRYGNVVGSRGSVVGLWRGQVAAGLPLTLTDPAMTRFLLTLPQAVQLIVDTLATMEGGEIVVPDLPAARMVDLAAVVAPGHPAVMVGLRPGGEKYHETLLTGEEMQRAFYTGTQWIIPPALAPWRIKSQYLGGPVGPGTEAYTSDRARRLSPEALGALLAAALEGGSTWP